MPSNNTGSEHSLLEARSEKGSRQALAQMEGPGALITQMERERERGQWVGRDSRGPEEAQGADPMGIKKGTNTDGCCTLTDSKSSQ